MLDKDPMTYPILTYLWVIIISSVGGIVGFLRKYQDRKDLIDFRFVEFIGEVLTSAFVGILTFWLCEASDMDALLTAALVGVSGHMGSRALYSIENLIKRKIL